MKYLVAMAALAAGPALVRADFSYQETTRVTGGAMAGAMKFVGAFSKRANQPVQTNIYVKGNKMARINQFTGEIIDLDAKTVTHLDFEKKTYSVMTFEQMQQMMDQAMQNMKNRKQSPDGQDVQMKFKVDTKETGQTKTIAGMNAKEVLVSVEMDAQNQQNSQQAAATLLSHVWLTPTPAGYAEVRDFEKRLYASGGMISQQQAAQMQQNMQGMVEVNSTMAKLDGMPVLTVLDMMMAGNPPAGGQQPQQGAERQQSQTQDGGAQGGLAGMAARGIFGGFGRKKKDSAESQPASSAPPGTLMELTTDYSGFSDASVDSSQLVVPAGFKQVEPDLNAHGRR